MSLTTKTLVIKYHINFGDRDHPNATPYLLARIPRPSRPTLTYNHPIRVPQDAVFAINIVLSDPNVYQLDGPALRKTGPGLPVRIVDDLPVEQYTPRLDSESRRDRTETAPRGRRTPRQAQRPPAISYPRTADSLPPREVYARACALLRDARGVGEAEWSGARRQRHAESRNRNRGAGQTSTRCSRGGRREDGMERHANANASAQIAGQTCREANSMRGGIQQAYRRGGEDMSLTERPREARQYGIGADVQRTRTSARRSGSQATSRTVGKSSTLPEESRHPKARGSPAEKQAPSRTTAQKKPGNGTRSPTAHGVCRAIPPVEDILSRFNAISPPDTYSSRSSIDDSISHAISATNNAHTSSRLTALSIPGSSSPRRTARQDSDSALNPHTHRKKKQQDNLNNKRANDSSCLPSRLVSPPHRRLHHAASSNALALHKKPHWDTHTHRSSSPPHSSSTSSSAQPSNHRRKSKYPIHPSPPFPSRALPGSWPSPSPSPSSSPSPSPTQHPINLHYTRYANAPVPRKARVRVRFAPVKQCHALDGRISHEAVVDNEGKTGKRWRWRKKAGDPVRNVDADVNAGEVAELVDREGWCGKGEE
ncbi:hypothetical protein BU26DRAFT_602590 [Trematosphaeria pertusa]|uniref:Uncharacterized protein n=1 Tax=Trematosphaeria pertusa TaxID=390896 RepID=A0A6A6IRJ4_9PLEO|nr:uncharacterized protein BU26DRAFT_602590 [Trematosphaeria pertusa]KAF2252143.1 hypothetical protein BU26DRAFT_602590 [Trematosphaeria pertusa]